MMSSPFLVPNSSCIPLLAETCRSYDGHSSTCLELYSTLQSSAACLNPFFKVNTTRHELSAASFHSRNLLRQLSKKRLVVRCIPISARQSFRRRTPLRLTLARTPSATLCSALRLLHLVRRISSVRIPSQESPHFGRIEGRDSRLWRSALCVCSPIARLAALASALRPEVAWLLSWLSLGLVRLRLLGGRGRCGVGAVLWCS